MSSESSAEAAVNAALGALPPRLRRSVAWLLSRWPGRIAIRSAGALIRIELFDRSMALAAQFFTSVFPILIIMAAWAGGSDVAGAVGMHDESREVLDQALEQGSSSPTFGLVGVLIVLISATSLSRALTRAFAAVWLLPRPKSTLRSAWRWVAVVIALALSLVAVRALARYADGVPPPNVWHVVVSVAADLAIGVFVPWVLLAGVVPPRHLAPGALIFGVLMLAVRPASSVWLPRALESSADRYGSIGVAFTYLAWLYVVSFCFLVAAAVGQVITTDRGWFGTWIRGSVPAPPPPP
jgi:membrane protein